MIPYSKQSISSRDIANALKVLGSDWITQGPKIPEFEERLAKFCGAKYAIAVANGTAALHLACLALGVQPGDEVITSPNTFLATSNSILFCGGRPVFADIDSKTFNLDPAEARRKISSRTKGMIPVHFAGHPCDMESLAKIAKKHGLFILEDASHAFGARFKTDYKWQKIGSTSHSDACIFSFHPVKAMTTGEGGAITTNRKDLYEKLLSLRSHGMVKQPELFQNTDLAFWKKNGQNIPNPWYYEMQSLGTNSRITDFQCALGISQLSRLEDFIKRRREIAQTYHQAFKDVNTLIIPQEVKGFESAYHLYVLQFKLERLSAGRAEIFHELRQKGVGVHVHYIPIHLQPYYQNLGYKKGDFPKAESYYERAISIPIFPAMTQAQVREVIKKVAGVVRSYEI